MVQVITVVFCSAIRTNLFVLVKYLKNVDIYIMYIPLLALDILRWDTTEFFYP